MRPNKVTGPVWSTIPAHASFFAWLNSTTPFLPIRVVVKLGPIATSTRTCSQRTVEAAVEGQGDKHRVVRAVGKDIKREQGDESGGERPGAPCGGGVPYVCVCLRGERLVMISAAVKDDSVTLVVDRCLMGHVGVRLDRDRAI